MSHILDKFLILFDSDASKVKKEADEAGHATERLTERINLGHGAAIRLGESLHENIIQLAGFVGAFLTVEHAVEGVKEAIHAAAELGETAETVGVSTEALSAWGGAAERVGGSAEGFAQSLAAVSASLAQVDVTGKSRAAPFFEELGVRMNDAHGKARPVLDLYLDIAKAFEKMSKQQSLGFGRKMGLDEGTIRLLQQGKDGVQALIEHETQLGIVTEDQADAARKFRQGWDDVTRSFSMLELTVGTDLLPTLERFGRALVNLASWLRDLPGLIERYRTDLESVGVTAAIVATIIGAVLLPSLIKVGVEGAVALLPLLVNMGALAIIAGLLALPFIAAGAAIAFFVGVIYVTVQDLITFLHGGKSLLGPMWQSDLKLIQEIVAAVKELWQWIKNLASAGGAKFMAGVDFVEKHIGLGKQAVASANGVGNAAMASAASGKTQNQTVQIGTIEVHTQATDADGMAKGVGSALQQHLKQTLTNHDDGVAG